MPAVPFISTRNSIMNATGCGEQEATLAIHRLGYGVSMDTYIAAVTLEEAILRMAGYDYDAHILLEIAQAVEATVDAKLKIARERAVPANVQPAFAVKNIDRENLRTQFGELMASPTDPLPADPLPKTETKRAARRVSCEPPAIRSWNIKRSRTIDKKA